jgi:hypothetical protein
MSLILPHSEQLQQQYLNDYVKNITSFNQKTHDILTLFNNRELSPHFFDADFKAFKEKLKLCGKRSLKYKIGSLEYAIPTTCKDRFCEYCAKKRSARVRNSLNSIKNDFFLNKKKNQMRFLTLTIKNVQKIDIAVTYDKLIKAFQNLKRSTLWKNNVEGALQAYEITVSNENQYHPHIHILYQGKYITQSLILTKWAQIVNRLGLKSTVVDIRAVRDLDKAFFEISKYCFKPSNFTIVDKYFVNKALYRRNLYGFSGTWYKHLKNIARNNPGEIDEEYSVVRDIVKYGHFRGVIPTPEGQQVWFKHPKHNLYYKKYSEGDYKIQGVVYHE